MNRLIVQSFKDSYIMEARLNFFKANPEAMKTLSAVEQA